MTVSHVAVPFLHQPRSQSEGGNKLANRPLLQALETPVLLPRAPQSTHLEAVGTNHPLLSEPGFLFSPRAQVSLSQHALKSVKVEFPSTGLTWQPARLTSDTQGLSWDA